MTATTLRRIATLWPDLHNALGDRAQHAWPPPSLRGYLNALEQYDPTEAAALRALERSPDQLGTRPVPIDLRIHDTMRTIEAGLHECATQIASANQHDVNTSHPHRWYFTGPSRGPVWTALWLSARVDGVFWPGRALTEAQRRHVASVASGALNRIETTLDIADQQQQLAAEHPCQCGGTITLYGGGGATPCANCTSCGAIWSEAGVIAA